MRLPHRTSGNSTQLQMTAMIDVVFLLLVFFLWTSSFEEPEYDLPSSLAEPPAGLAAKTDTPPPPEAFDELVITVEEQGTQLALALNGDGIADLEELKKRLESVVSLGIQPPVIVDPSPQTSSGAAIDIYDVARSAGLDRVLFAANPQ